LIPAADNNPGRWLAASNVKLFPMKRMLSSSFNNSFEESWPGCGVFSPHPAQNIKTTNRIANRDSEFFINEIK
jgi:hypothetical protein